MSYTVLRTWSPTKDWDADAIIDLGYFVANHQRLYTSPLQMAHIKMPKGDSVIVLYRGARNYDEKALIKAILDRREGKT